MSFGSNRQQEAKNWVQGKGHTVSQQRALHRHEFVRRLKSLRIKEVDKLRKLSCEDYSFSTLVEMRKLLLSEANTRELMNDQELADVVKQVEDEILFIQEEARIENSKRETGIIAEQLMNKCSVCENLIVEGQICTDCVNIHFN